MNPQLQPEIYAARPIPLIPSPCSQDGVPSTFPGSHCPRGPGQIWPETMAFQPGTVPRKTGASSNGLLSFSLPPPSLKSHSSPRDALPGPGRCSPRPCSLPAPGFGPVHRQGLLCCYCLMFGNKEQNHILLLLVPGAQLTRFVKAFAACAGTVPSLSFCILRCPLPGSPPPPACFLPPGILTQPCSS